jgi:HlyD family secretion protein
MSKTRILTLFAAIASCSLVGCDTNQSALPLVGTLERDRLELVAEANERITAVKVVEGERVAAGTVLMEFDRAQRAAELKAAEALALAVAERLAELVRGPRAELIREARARLTGARENLVVQNNEYARVETLIERGLASDSDLDRAGNRRVAAIADVDALAAALDALLEGTTREELAQAEAKQAEAQARVELAELALDRLEIRAPQNGQIDAIPYKLGERPAAGSTVLIMLAEQRPYARVYVPEPLRARIVPGLAATIEVDGLPGLFDAVVRYVAADASFTPYRSLTQRDRSRLAFLAEVELTADAGLALPSGVPVEVDFPSLR